jgi:hypothetical protein
MKPYGIPRSSDVQYPDVGDIQTYGMKSYVGQIIRKSGDYRSYTRSTKKKRSIRIYWKRRERNKIKRELSKYFT